MHPSNTWPSCSVCGTSLSIFMRNRGLGPAAPVTFCAVCHPNYGVGAPVAERRTTSEVFVDAVRDILDGTPGASHPVQFEDLPSLPLVACTLCGAAVYADDRWKEQHRKNHDDHNKVHDDNLDAALAAADSARTKYYGGSNNMTQLTDADEKEQMRVFAVYGLYAPNMVVTTESVESALRIYHDKYPGWDGTPLKVVELGGQDA